MIGREKHYSKKYNFNSYRAAQFDQLENSFSARKNKLIQGVPAYRPLDSLKYKQMFQFEPPTFTRGVLDMKMHERFLYNSEGKLVMDPKQSDLAYLTLMIGFFPQRE